MTSTSRTCETEINSQTTHETMSETMSENDESFLLQHRNRLDESLHYEELVNPSRNSITCPTCSGLGRLPKTSKNELVALVPYNDERLKPRRTKCFIFTGMILTALIFTSVIFLLIPRSVTFLEEKNSPNTTKVTVDQDGASVSIDLEIVYYSENWNYYPISLNSLDIKVMYELYIVRNVTLTPKMLHLNSKNNYYTYLATQNQRENLISLNDTVTDANAVSVDINARQKEVFQLEINEIVFSKDNHLNLIVDHCLWPWRKFNKIPLQFQSTLNISYWYGHSELIQQMTYHF